jgi:gluconokinase/xylulokinase
VRAGVPVAVGASDGTLGSIGAGAVRPGRAVDVAGSTDVLFVAHDRPPTLSGVEAVTNPHPIPGMFFVGGPTGLTGGGIERLMALLGYDSSRDARDALGPELDSIPPGSAGLRIDPCLTGSRFPRWRERDRGVVAGLSLGHTRAHLYQAAQEGSAFVVAEGIDALHAVGIEFDEIVVVGGVASNHALLQLRCDAWDIPVRASAEPEASSLGTAMVAAVAAGLYGDIGEAATAMVRPGLRFEPDREVASALAVARAEWLAMERPEAPPETFA